MPIYEYECPKCGRFESLQKISDQPLKECPMCLKAGSTSAVHRLISAAAFHLKGSGWYKTDYASNGSSKNGSETKPKSEAQPGEPAASSESKQTEESKKTETKTESKSE